MLPVSPEFCILLDEMSYMVGIKMENLKKIAGDKHEMLENLTKAGLKIRGNKGKTRGEILMVLYNHTSCIKKYACKNTWLL